jgi:hypothetical protein
MMRNCAGIAGALVLGFAITAEAAPRITQEKAERILAECVAETHAPGSYSVQLKSSGVQVAGGAGATSAGIWNVNDCFKDRLVVTYNTRGTGKVTGAVASDDRTKACQRIRNRRITTAVAATVGVAVGLDVSTSAALVGGAVGVGIESRRASRSYRDCLANGAVLARANERRRGGAGCVDGADVMQNGGSICVGYK